MKKLLAIAMSLTFMVTAFSCGTKPQNSNDNMSEISSISISQTLYKEEKTILPPEDFVEINGCIRNENGILYFYSDLQKKTHAVQYDFEMNISENIILENSAKHMLTHISADSNGNIHALCYSYSDFSDVMYNTYDNSGKLVSSVSLGDVNGHYDDGDTSLLQFSAYEDKLLFSFGNEAVLMSTDGKVLSSVPVINGNTFYTFDNKGDILCISDFVGFKRMNKLKIPDESMEFTEFPSGSVFQYKYCDGDDRFSVYLVFSDGLYGITHNDEFVKVVDFLGSKLNFSEISFVVPVSDKQIFTASWYESKLYNIRPDDYSENRQKVIVGMKNYINTDEYEKAMEFEKLNDDYKIEFREYDSEQEKLNLDILTGDAPDLYIYNQFDETMKYVNLGAFADIDELSAKYGGLNSDYFLPNITDGMRYRGKLYCMGTYFIPYLYFVKKEYADIEGSNWTLDEFFEIAENMPYEMALGEQYAFREPIDVFYYLCADNLEEWIDFENMTCDFNSAAFIKTLEFCRDVKLCGIMPDNFSDYSTDLEIQAAEEENYTLVCNDKALLGALFGTNTESMISTLYMNGLELDDIILLSKPNRKGEYSAYLNEYCAVLNCGKCEQGAWEYFNYLMSYENQTKFSMFSLPTSKEAFDYAMKYQIETFNNRKEHSFNINNYTKNFKLTLNDENVQFIKNAFSNCSEFSGSDSEICMIMGEEFNKFISDESTSEQCAENIQTRVEILLSENV